MAIMHNSYGLFYINKDGKKYFYKSYPSEKALYYAIENDQDFAKLDKKEVIVIKLEDLHENYS